MGNVELLITDYSFSAYAELMMRFFWCLLWATFGFAGNVGAQQTATPGHFDFYLLTLSWSPEYCHSNPTDGECTGGHHFGFIVHGMWPELQNGGSPENCSNAPGLSNPSSFLDIMPDLSLIQHEWTTHGTCSGLSAQNYFNLIRQAFTSIHIPNQFRAPATVQTLTPLQIKAAFEQSNPKLQDADLMIVCSGAYLKAVEICVTKGLSPMACPAPRNCTARSIRVPPVQ
jgi:ribonuclease T2